MPLNRILFIPVSSPKGVGEYVRSLSIAQELANQHQEIKIHFILSEQVNYIKDCPFPMTLCPTSPTFHNKIVKTCISEFKPDVVIFDAAGRASQLRFCKNLGINTIFICPRIKKISKSLKLRRLLYTNYIWITQPSFLVPALNLWQRTKLAITQKPKPAIIGPIFLKPSNQLSDLLQKKYDLINNKYIIVNSGGGGHIHNDIPVNIIFFEAARILSSFTDYKIVVINGSNATKQSKETTDIIQIDQLTPIEFNSLLQGAEAALLAGGSVVLQSLSYKQKIVSAPINDEQKKRIVRLESFQFLVKSDLIPELMAKKVMSLINNQYTLKDADVENGLDKAISEINKILVKA